MSNSSSSSFILPVDGTADEITVTIPLSQLYTMFGDGDYSESGVRKVVETEQDLKEYILSEYGWRDATLEEVIGDDDYIQEIYDNSLSQIQEGKKLIFGSVSYHDSGLENMLKQLGAKITE